MKIIGLIGGVASGKSTAARLLQARGALWLNSDEMAHQVLNSPEAIELVRERFGETVLAPDGRPDRSQIASLVFGDSADAKANLVWLQSILHPRVRRLTEQRIADAQGHYQLAIVDAPLLLEAGWGPHCDRILFVDTPREVRAKLAAGRGWATEELERREAAQMPLEQKRTQATDVIFNTGSIEDLALQVDQFVLSLANPT